MVASAAICIASTLERWAGPCRDEQHSKIRSARSREDRNNRY
jgi:hypothetical protein